VNYNEIHKIAFPKCTGLIFQAADLRQHKNHVQG